MDRRFRAGRAPHRALKASPEARDEIAYVLDTRVRRMILCPSLFATRRKTAVGAKAGNPPSPIAEPGVYLVICNVRQHFQSGQFGFVEVKAQED